ncbi:MAG TPA: ATP-binding protein, partial [Candidatus Atribacteria bacterium]|nr:ATP-binding protein [Candidatus Atribacteria bacterium]
MKFYNRTKEIQLLEKVIRGKGEKFIIIKGVRRIGKTRLILELLKDKNYAYIFIPKDKTVSSFLEEISGELKIPRFTKLIDFFKYIFEKYEFVFLDEFQNFYYMEKSAYSNLQKLIDKFKRQEKNLCIFTAGSSYSLIKKIFSDYSKALYGRRDLEVTLEELDIGAVFQILDDLNIKNIEEKIKFWSIFGGMPKHYELIEILSPKSFKEFIEMFFLTNFKSMLDEGNSILKSEFGGEYKTYYTVMEAIAQGKTKLSEIASFFNGDNNRANRYTDLLRKEYNLIIKLEPIIAKNAAGKYQMRNNFFSFWFRYVKKYESYYEQGRTNEAVGFFHETFNSYVGRMFEKFCLELIKQYPIIMPIQFDRIGEQRGKFKGEKGKNTYEIVMV